MKIYFELYNGKIVDNYQLSTVAAINGIDLDAENKDDVMAYARSCKGIARLVEDPSVEYFLAHGNNVAATILYREQNGGTLVEARKAIENMKSCA